MPMLHTHVSGAGDRWRDRCNHWATAFESRSSRKRRERSSEPLILCGHGISLRVEGGTLAVKNGFTHYPQQQETFRYFRGDLDRPSRIIVLDGSGHLTFDVFDWLAEQDVPLIRVTWKGEVTTVAGGSGYGADREKIEWQRRTRENLPERVAFSVNLIRQKIRNSAATLSTIFPTTAGCKTALQKLAAEDAELEREMPVDIQALHGIEGRAAAAYFEAWQRVPLSWRLCRRKPIPKEWANVGQRSSLRAGKKSKNRNATHPVNAMLNYGYAVAVGQLKIQALAQGFDPTIGIMHHGYRESPAFALDLVEPVRPLVDRAVLGLALSTEMHPADFVLTGAGECRLNPQMARRIVQLATSAETLSRCWLIVSSQLFIKPTPNH